MRFRIFIGVWSAALLVSCSPRNNNEQIEELFKSSADTSLPRSLRIIQLKKLEEYCQREMSDSLYLQNSLKVANRYWNIGDIAHFKRINEDLLRRDIDNVNKANIHFNLGEAYFKLQKPDSAYINFKKASKIFWNTKDMEHYAQSLSYEGQLQYHYGEYYLAEKSAYQVLSIVKKTSNLDDERYRALNLLGNIYMDIKEYNRSLKFHFEALQFYKQGHFKRPFYYKEVTLFNLGLVHSHMEKYSDATKYFRTVLNSNIKETYPALYANVIDHLAAIEMLSQPQERHLQLILKAQRLNDSLNIISNSILNDAHLGQYYSLTGDTRKSELYFAQGLKKCSQAHYPITTLDLLKESLTHLNNRNPLDVLYFQLQDSVNQKEKLARDKFARIHYETSEAISQKESQVRAKKFFVATTFFLALSIIFLIVIIIQKSKTAKLASEKQEYRMDEKAYQLMLESSNQLEMVRIQERRKIARELHDNIMNRLLSIRLNMFVDNVNGHPKVERHISEIQQIELELREISHNLHNNELDGNSSFQTMLNNFFEVQKTISSIDFQYVISPDINWELIGSHVKINIYRIVQEGVSNSLKHADCSAIFLEINKAKNMLLIFLKDNGKGYDVRRSAGGIGISNIKTRVLNMNGNLKISSTKRGTILTIKIFLDYENTNN